MQRRGWRGSKHRSRVDVERILAEYDCREQSAVEFASNRGIKPETLRWWLRRRREEKSQGGSQARLVPVRLRQIEVGDAETIVEIVLTNGRRLRVPVHVDADACARLAAALETAC